MSIKNGNMPDIEECLSYTSRPEYGCIDLYYMGVKVTTWGYEDEAEDSFNEFKLVFMAGVKALLAKLEEKGK